MTRRKQMAILNKDINPGDKITITRTIVETKTVEVKGKGSYLIQIEDGHITNDAEPLGRGSCYPFWTVVAVKPVLPKVEHLPCQAGDVWRDKDGRDWAISEGYYSKGLNATCLDGTTTTTTSAKFEPSARKLMYRK